MTSRAPAEVESVRAVLNTWRVPNDTRKRPGLSPPATTSSSTTTASSTSPIDHEVPQEIDSDPADGTRVRTERWIGGDGTVAILRPILDGGHTWPSSNGQLNGGENFGATSREIDASADAIAFLLDPDEAGRSFGQ